MDSTSACLALSFFKGIGPTTFQKSLEIFSCPGRIFQASEKQLSLFLKPTTLANFLSFRSQIKISELWQDLKAKDINYLSFFDSQYPSLLKEIPDPPIGLFYKGNWESFPWDRIGFAIVGTRKPTSYGQKMAYNIARDLSTNMNIISGMALGIDTCAHTGCLSVNGKTIAVLGCGVDVIYPNENKVLYQQIINQDGLIISEFPPGLRSLKGLFVARNRIISGLSLGVLVVEGGEKSGSLITARYAAEQGREIYALPGQLGNFSAYAPLLLLKEGAHLFTSSQEVAKEFGLLLKKNILTKTKEIDSLTIEQKQVFQILTEQDLTTQDLINCSKITLPVLLPILSTLELAGLVKKNDQGQWQCLN